MKNNRRLDYIISENLDRVVRHKMANEQRFAAIFRNNLMNESAKLQKFVAKKSRSLQEGKGTPVNMDTQLAHMFEQATRKTLMECNARHIVLSEEDMRRVVREVIQEGGFWNGVWNGIKAGGKSIADSFRNNPLSFIAAPLATAYNAGKAAYNAGKAAYDTWSGNDAETPTQSPANTPAPSGGGGTTKPVAKKQRTARKQSPAKPQTAPSQPVETPAGKPSPEYLAAKQNFNTDLHIQAPQMTAQDWQNMARKAHQEIDAKNQAEAQAQRDAYNDALTYYNTQKADRQLIGSRAGRQYRNDWAEQEAERQGRGGDKQYIRQLSRQMKRDARAQRRGEFDNY